MSFMTEIYMLDLFLAVLLDRRFQIAVIIVWSIQWAWRLPRPRKGAGNKAIFVTCCDSGLGQRIVRRLDDMKVYVFAGTLNPNGPAAKKLKESCSQRLRIIPLDVSNEKMVQEAITFVKDNIPFGEKGLYGLVNNTGMLSFSNFELMTVEHCKQVIETNLLSTIYVTKHFLPLLKKIPGRIVNVSSVLARLTLPNTAVYSATKHGLNGFFSALKFDLSSAGIHVSMVEPGYVTMPNNMQAQLDVEETWEKPNTSERKDELHLHKNIEQLFDKANISSKNQEDDFKRIIEDVEDALFAEEPYHRYISAPLSRRLFLSFLRILPEVWHEGSLLKSSRMKKC